MYYSVSFCSVYSLDIFRVEVIPYKDQMEK